MFRLKALKCICLLFFAGLVVADAEAQSSMDAFVLAAKVVDSDGFFQSGDYVGHSVAIDGSTAIAGAPGEDGLGRNAGAVYLFTMDGRNAKLTASDGAEGDQFGHSVSIDGNTIVIGALGDDGGKGAAYVFTRAGGIWTQTAKLTASDGIGSDQFGHSVSVSGNTIAVGARLHDENDNDSGAVYVFGNESGTWMQTAKLLADDNTGNNNDQFGYSVSIEGNTIVVGAPYDYPPPEFRHSGSVYVFNNNGGTWTQTAKLLADDIDHGDQFGHSVSVAGNMIAVGGRYLNGNERKSGAVLVFSNDGGAWTQTAKLIADDGAHDDQFGHSVSIEGNTIVVGARNDYLSSISEKSGSAYVFNNDGGTWSQTAKLFPDDGGWDDEFGASVSVSGNTVFIGARLDDQEWVDDSGFTYLYSNAGGTWARTATLAGANKGNGGDSFGWSIAVSGNTAVVAGGYTAENRDGWGQAYVFSYTNYAWTETAVLKDDSRWGNFGERVGIDGNTIVVSEHWRNGHGGVNVFSNDSGTWARTATLTPSDAMEGDGFGYSMAVSGHTIVVGGHNYDNRDGWHHVYVFSNDGGTWTETAILRSEETWDAFGERPTSVAIDGKTIVIGAKGADGGKGAVYVFGNDGGTWTQTAKLTASDGIGGDQFGHSVSIDGNTIVVGGTNESKRDGWGQAYVFNNDGGTWTETAILKDDLDWGAFGEYVATDGNTIVVSERFQYHEESGTNPGGAHVFRNDGGTWTRIANLQPSDGAQHDEFGRSVSISGGTIVIGAPFHDDQKGAAYIYQAPQATLLQRADADGSGVIDVVDFAAFAAAFGTADSRFDFDGNGIVDVADFVVFADIFGQSVS